jgi:O-antigen ligase
MGAALGSHEHRRDARRAYRLAGMALLGLVLALGGGASRFDEDQQVLVRLAAIAAIVASLWPLDFEALRQRWRMIAFVAAAYLLLLLQLAPLPPALWQALPGHEVYAQIAKAARSSAWRPLSLTPDLTLESLYALLPATAAGLGALYLDSRAHLRLAQGIAAVACLSGVLGLLQLATGGLHLFRETSTDSAVGLFANRNHQAALMACALPLVGAAAGLHLLEGGDRRVAPPVALSTAALLLAALALTGSRMGLLLAAVGVLGGLWSYKMSGQRVLPASMPARLALAAFAAPALAALAVTVARGGVIHRITTDGVANDTRAAMLGPLLSTAGAFMPFGAGIGSFDSVYRRFEPNSLLSTIYMNQAHDEPLQLAIEGGLPALALLALFLAWWMRTAVKAIQPGSQGRRTIGAAAIAVTAILMASSLVDYPLRTPLLGAIFAVACVQMMRAADGFAGVRPE